MDSSLSYGEKNGGRKLVLRSEPPEGVAFGTPFQGYGCFWGRFPTAMPWAGEGNAPSVRRKGTPQTKRPASPPGHAPTGHPLRRPWQRRVNPRSIPQPPVLDTPPPPPSNLSKSCVLTSHFFPGSTTAQAAATETGRTFCPEKKRGRLPRPACRRAPGGSRPLLLASTQCGLGRAEHEFSPRQRRHPGHRAPKRALPQTLCFRVRPAAHGLPAALGTQLPGFRARTRQKPRQRTQRPRPCQARGILHLHPRWWKPASGGRSRGVKARFPRSPTGCLRRIRSRPIS